MENVAKTYKDMVKEFTKSPLPYWKPEWTKLEGEWIMQVKGSQYAALPVTGKKSSPRFEIFHTKTRQSLTQLKKKEVSGWLVTKARSEGVKPTGIS